MVEYKTIIDNKNNIVQECVLFIDGIAKDYIIKGNQIIVEFLDKTYINPKWDFEKEEWVEGATDEEIKEWEEKNKPVEKEPTETEILQRQLLETQNMLLELQYKLTNKDLTNNLK
ncbi:hypothetical protein HYH38_08245 [Clostridium botulinum]|uniref:hypothetical protein n=1 Tax=Clostridium botulinum TaxID=1491 RepID=UPI001C9A86A9|nr:hypothetical protein [Clostridium botulinum]MBY6816476.1 hypothetical protein [Clostridium botulinum]MBY6827269.1 hypothetical protein [Clostridium botulinum]MBY6859217.1 hypothetical protein [Clostridium botulinum]MBY7041499.1 hypothetical protein [Clostridium botulinum]